MKVYLVWDYLTPDYEGDVEHIISIHRDREQAEWAVSILEKHGRKGHYYTVIEKELV